MQVKVRGYLKAATIAAVLALVAAGSAVFGMNSAATAGSAYQLVKKFKESVTGRKAEPSAQHIARESLFSLSVEHHKVVFLGDSHTERAEWAEFFPASDTANRGIGGDTTALIDARMESALLPAPEKVFLMAGVNDIVNAGLGDEDVFPQYEGIVRKARSAGAKVYVQSTLYVGKAVARFERHNTEIAELNQRLKALCGTGACQFIDLNASLAPDGFLPEESTADGVHLLGPAYLIWADRIRGLVS
ncbi:MAG: GDSL-type esterase/lipase family protein [Pseudomonadales bacterium]